MPDASANVTIQNKLGLHARPAMSFVDIANTFSSDIKINKGEQTADGKSIFQIMMLGAGVGTDLTLSASGSDADAAIAALAELVNGKFGED